MSPRCEYRRCLDHARQKRVTRRWFELQRSKIAGPLLWKLGSHRFIVFTVYLHISIVCLVLHVTLLSHS